MRSLLDFGHDMVRAVPTPRLRRPKHPLNLTGCPAPVHSSGGWLRCVTRRPCDLPGHDRWPMLPMALIWWVAPWWPNQLGRDQDRGLAHTPNVIPCRHCERKCSCGHPIAAHSDLGCKVLIEYGPKAVGLGWLDRCACRRSEATASV